MQGIPALIFVDESGQKIISDGRKVVLEDELAEGFPWRPKTAANALANHFVNNQGHQFTRKHLSDKNVAILFGAPKDSGTKDFVPKLSELYTKAAEHGAPFEVIFVSTGHRYKSEFDGMFDGMPWWAIKSNFLKRRAELVNFFEVQQIPTLIVLDKDLATISSNGVAEVEADPTGDSIAWMHRTGSGQAPKVSTC